MLILPQLVAFSPSYTANAVQIDAAEYISRSTALSASNGKLMTLSMWVKPTDDGTVDNLFTADDDGRCYFRYDGFNNQFTIRWTNSATTAILLTGAMTLPTSGAWSHIIASFDMANTANRHVYVNDVNQSPSYSTYTNDSLYLAAARFGLTSYSSTRVNPGDFADVWFTNEYIDLSVTANRRKFINSAGKPVDLGDTGTLPTGTQPLIYFSKRTGEAAADFGTNKGSGGSFIITGTLSDASSSPSD